MSETVIKIENLKKQYRLGSIGGGTLRADIQSWWARKRGNEDPNTKIGTDVTTIGDAFYALNGINLEVKKGEALGIIGANGAGKSTLLKLMARVTAPTEGSIKMKGRIASMLEVGTGFHPELTGRENIYMNGAILGMTKVEIDSKIEDIIDFSECRQFIDTPVKRYSSGMYVKLAFAVAAHLDAEIMIMDEVLAVGDVKFQEKCLGKMGDAAGHEGKTVLYVSHNMSTIRQLCNRCIVLSHGEKIFDGDVESAIDAYIGIKESDFKCIYNFVNTKRPSLDHGKDIRIESFELIEKKEASYLNGEKMRFRIRWNSKKRVDKMYLLMTILTAEDSNVGAAFSEPFEVDGNGLCDFEFDICNLAAGKYQIIIDMQELNDLGTHYSYDHPLQNVWFEITNDSAVELSSWNSKYYGNVVLNRIKVRR